MAKEITLYQVDAFTTKRFSGNPAAVCVLEETLCDDLMQQIAAEMNLSETAFVNRLPSSEGMLYSLRWFTPIVEIPLCGHATVATAASLLEGEGVKCAELHFQTKKSGVLTVKRSADGLYHLSVPYLHPDPPSSAVQQLCDASSEIILDSLPGAHCLDVRHNERVSNKVFIALEGLSQKQFEDWKPPIAQLRDIPDGQGVIVSCAGQAGQPELLLRFFAPWAGIDEDPVTGSAYAVAGPWWAKRLGKACFTARQCSKRGGDLTITVDEASGLVDVAGGAVLVTKGSLLLD